MQFILHAEADDTENEIKFLLCSHSAYHSEHNHLEHVAKSERQNNSPVFQWQCKHTMSIMQAMTR